MLTKLPEELLNTVQQYCNRKDWKRFMDTSKEFFRDLKYRTIHVKVSFGKLEDRVLPPIVGKLSNPLQQLHLYLDTEDSLQEDAAEAKSSWSSWGTWRSRNLVTHKDIKWFLSIPAQSLDWYCAGPLLDDDVYMRALRKYEDIKLDLHPHINVFVPYDNLNNSKRIKYLDVSNGWGSKFPKLPSLVELTLSMDTGTEVDLRNLVYSLLLKKVTLEFCENTILLPKQLKDRGVIINCSNSSNLKFVEVEAEQSNNDDIHESNNDENDHQIEVRLSNIYNEDEITVYKHEDDEDGEYEDDEDEDDEEEDDDEDDDNDNNGDHHEDEGDQYNLRKGIEIVKVHEEVNNDNLDENEDEESSNSDFDYSRGKRKYQG